MLSLVVASLAAFAALMNAMVAVFTSLRDTVGLNIRLTPDIWGEKSDVLENHLWILRLANHTRLPNSVERVTCRIGTRELQVTADPLDLYLKQIEPFTVSRGWLKVPKNQVRDDSDVVAFTIVQVRGWRKIRRFRFPRRDLVLTKDELFRR